MVHWQSHGVSPDASAVALPRRDACSPTSVANDAVFKVTPNPQNGLSFLLILAM
jgi:hypothetical protein